MSYKKPQVVAKSVAKQSFVAGCPTIHTQTMACSSFNKKCETGRLR